MLLLHLLHWLRRKSPKLKVMTSSLGYVNTLALLGVSIYYEVAPTNGEACKEGWMNIGMGYCKKKKGP